MTHKILESYRKFHNVLEGFRMLQGSNKLSFHYSFSFQFHFFYICVDALCKNLTSRSHVSEGSRIFYKVLEKSTMIQKVLECCRKIYNAPEGYRMFQKVCSN